MTTSPHGDYADLQPSIGDRLRLTRERRTGLDQAAFAEHIGVSRGTVSNYERDHLPGGPRQRLVLNAWAQATRVTREWLETGEGPVDQGPVPPHDGPRKPDPDALRELAAKKRRRARGGSTREYVHVASAA